MVPVKVEVRKTADGKWELLRGGKPYLVKGAGGDYSRAVWAGRRNSIRLWGVDADTRSELDRQKKGVTVALGFWVGHERDGFKADDPTTSNGSWKRPKAGGEGDVPPAVLSLEHRQRDGERDETAGAVGIGRRPREGLHELDPNPPDDDRHCGGRREQVANLHKCLPRHRHRGH